MLLYFLQKSKTGIYNCIWHGALALFSQKTMNFVTLAK